MKSGITITPTAAERLENLATNPGDGVRLSLKKGGCAGMEYTLNVISKKPDFGLIIPAGQTYLVIDPMAEMFMLGTEIDYKEELLQSGFVFKNPNVTSSCGCGESISFG